jgi:hypothetical protein
MTPEAKAKAAVTRKANAERKVAHLAREAAYKAAQDKHAATLRKVEAMANDPRGNENVRAVAASMIEQVKAKAPPKPPGPDLPFRLPVPERLPVPPEIEALWRLRRSSRTQR